MKDFLSFTENTRWSFRDFFEIGIFVGKWSTVGNNVQKIATTRLSNSTFEWDWLNCGKVPNIMFFHYLLTSFLSFICYEEDNDVWTRCYCPGDGDEQWINDESLFKELFKVLSLFNPHMVLKTYTVQDCVFLEMVWFPAPSRGWLLWSQSAGCLQSTRAKVFMLKLL